MSTTNSLAGPNARSLVDVTAVLAETLAGRLTASDLVAVALERIAQRDGQLRAFMTVAADQAVEDARRLDDEGPHDRPLFGLTLAVKDLLDTAGLRTTHGSLAYADRVPAADDVIVGRAKSAGAVIVGKTNTPEFGFGAVCQNALCGPTAHPLDPELTSGGSSGGSAVAVATGMATWALGTDYGGSVRMPAAFCGVVGFRPSPGRLPTLGRSLTSDGLNTTGLLTRSVRDARLLFEVLEGPEASDAISLRGWPARRDAPERLRLAVTADFGCAPMSRAVAAGFAHAESALKAAFGGLSRTHPDCAGALESFATMRAANIHHHLSRMRDTLGDAMSPTVRWNIERGDELRAADYLAAEAKRWEVTRRFDDFFADFDVLVSPSTAIMPFRHDEGEVLSIDGKPLQSLIEYFTVTLIISLVGCPAISIPFWPEGMHLPIGLQLVGASGADHALLQAAERIEAGLQAG